MLKLNVKAQRIAESLLAGKCGAAVALNPKTGAVLRDGLVADLRPEPDREAAGYAKIQATQAPCAPAAPLLNRATQGLYPPGSTFKTVTAAAALDDGVFTPTSTFYDPGYCTEYGKRVSNALDQTGGAEAFGNVSLVEAYEHSINAVFCKIGKKLGAGKDPRRGEEVRLLLRAAARDALRLRGLPRGSTTGRASSSTRRHPDTAVDPGRLAFGQERMLVTPLQMAMVAATIANGGNDAEADARQAGRDAGRQRGHAACIRTSGARGQAGDGGGDPRHDGAGRPGRDRHAAQIPGVTVAGKTGTAETGDCSYYDAWFIFFAPAEHPVVAGAVVVENQLNGFGGAIAAPIAKAIMQAILPAASNAKP